MSVRLKLYPKAEVMHPEGIAADICECILEGIEASDDATEVLDRESGDALTFKELRARIRHGALRALHDRRTFPARDEDDDEEEAVEMELTPRVIRSTSREWLLTQIATMPKASFEKFREIVARGLGASDA